MSIPDFTGPLTQFQCITLEREDLFKVIDTINKRKEEQDKNGLSEERLKSAYEKWWTELEEQLKKAKSSHEVPTKERPSEDKLNEILVGVREILNRLEVKSGTLSDPEWRDHIRRTVEAAKVNAVREPLLKAPPSSTTPQSKGAIYRGLMKGAITPDLDEES